MDKGTAQDYIEDLIIERDRLQAQLRELAERFSAQEAKHYRIIRSLEAERDQWQRQAMNHG